MIIHCYVLVLDTSTRIAYAWFTRLNSWPHDAGIDKVVAHATLPDVLVVEGYTPEFDPAKVLVAIRKLDSQARFYD